MLLAELIVRGDRTRHRLFQIGPYGWNKAFIGQQFFPVLREILSEKAYCVNYAIWPYEMLVEIRPHFPENLVSIGGERGITSRTFCKRSW